MSKNNSVGINSDTYLGSLDMINGLYDEFRPQLSLPEHRLLRAMISRSIFDCLALSKDIKPVHRLAAQAFVLSHSTEPWSFNWLCDHTDIDPTKVRRVIDALLKSNKAIKTNEEVVNSLLQCLVKD